MPESVELADSVGRRFEVLRPHLDERQRRLLLGAEAGVLGRGGIKAVAAATGTHPDTVARGVQDLEGITEPVVRVRLPGGGRKKLSVSDPQLMAELKALVDPETQGDPMSLLVWTTRNLAAALTQSGHRVSDRTVAKMLRDLGFGLQANAKVTEGRQHEDRDAQFGYLAGQVAEYARDGQPVISVDTKKKELVGDFKNGGREYQPTGQPEARQLQVGLFACPGAKEHRFAFRAFRGGCYGRCLRRVEVSRGNARRALERPREFNVHAQRQSARMHRQQAVVRAVAEVEGAECAGDSGLAALADGSEGHGRRFHAQ